MVRSIHGHLWIHLVIGLAVLFALLVGGGALFHGMFQFLLRQEIFGAPLMERLVIVVLLAFFSMLIFSNLIITLTTTYISRDTEFLFTYPIAARSIFSVKLVESIFYSSWAFVLLSLPLFASYGVAKGAPLLYYPAAMLAGLPFLVIPASMGAVITMLISAFLPARRVRTYSLGLVVLGIVIAAGVVRMMGLRRLVSSGETDEFAEIMNILNVGNAPLLPHYWLGQALRAASEGQWATCGWWVWCLLITAAAVLQICLWLAPAIYYRGWILAREAVSGSKQVSGWSPFKLMDRLLTPLSRPLQAMVSKDFRTFLRDPAQWSQLVVLFGLLVIYIANIRGLTYRLSALEQFLPNWPTILSFFNLGATCFVICILTTRFIYPMLSLEGKQYWIIGLAPFPKRYLLWEKYALCLVTTLALATVLILFSNRQLKVEPALATVSLATIGLMSFGLTSLAVGLGAIFPDFRQDNPARIANGIGGTLNIVLSLTYIASTLAVALPPAIYLSGQINQGLGTWQAMEQMFKVMYLWITVYAVIHLLTIVVPMLIGGRRWERLEISL